MTARSQKRASRKRADLDQDITAALPAIEERGPVTLLQRLIRLREAASMKLVLTHTRAGLESE
jgi:hypothetical protein